jgi:hypothetical protein
MIIRHLTFHHFLLYHGDQRLELPTDGERTLTVVVAPNNAGKTSIIRGLKFWFYGEKGLTENSKPLALMSNRAKAETAGDKRVTWLQLQGVKDKGVLHFDHSLIIAAHRYAAGVLKV